MFQLQQGLQDFERGRCVLQEGLYLGLDEFFDLNTEMNFFLKEVLELEEKMEEEEDLGPDVIWVCGMVEW